MRLLLDTHLLLWAGSFPERLSRETKQLIEDHQNELLFSVASIWEIAIKYGRGRKDFFTNPALFRQDLLQSDYREMPILSEHAIAVAALPPIHKDPFDRILIAQAMVEGAVLLTADLVVAKYPAPIRLV